MAKTGRTDAGEHLPFSFALPAGFQEIDLAGSPQHRADSLLNKLRASLPGIGADDLLHAVLANQHMVEQMVAGGVAFAADFVGRSEKDPTALTVAQFTVTCRDAEVRATKPLEVVASSMRREHAKKRHVDFVDLRIGRCLTVIEEDQVFRELTITGQERAHRHIVRQIQVIAPLAERSQLTFFSLSTECIRDWDDYVKLMAGICKTISWSESRDGVIASVLDP